MKCHRTIGPDVPVPVFVNGSPCGWSELTPPKPRDCIGSACSVWIQQPGRAVGWCGEVVEESGGSACGQTWPDPNHKPEEPTP